MTARSFNIFLKLTIYLGFILQLSHGFEVIQPKSRTINPDGSVTVTCEHTADVKTVQDVGLRAASLTDSSKKQLLCRKGKKDCKNITMLQENPNKWHFIMLHIGPQAMNMKYECEFTVKIGDLDYTETGTPTILLPGQKEGPCMIHPTLPPASHHLRWILIGLLALIVLYSCVISSLYISLRCCYQEPENCTYVEMRKAPQPRNPPVDIYCG
ncbi:uncharacterized protein LOC116689079 [Etheostoma spectabile]|uniref:Immunoglobulin V-set domain-containing protein n=1 Tax=Etheostoma spectabile TaxID=54343 RepID=A0A5J5DI59_9PERO|nr:uncharacterized protein LOC116689079 [Etheostoma spectabile]KAA8593064.1 hypothetical protein FQN60_018519 [Etheostoma spectabile]